MTPARYRTPSGRRELNAVEDALVAFGPAHASFIAAGAKLDRKRVREALEELAAQGRIVVLPRRIPRTFATRAQLSELTS